MSLGIDGSPKSNDSSIRTDSKTAIQQEVIQLRAEDQWLRQQLAAQQERIEELESELKRYKNAHTPSSRQGGADGSGGNNSSDSDGKDTDTDQKESAGGDDAASDFSPRRDKGHDGTTRQPPEPEETVQVDEGYCPDCECVLTNPDEYVSQIVIDISLPVPTTVIEYELGQHERSCGNEIVAEHPDCPKTRRFNEQLPNRKQAELFEWKVDELVSHRTVYNLTKRVADRLQPAYEQVKESVQESDVIYVDETGFPVESDQHWVWTAEFVADRYEEAEQLCEELHELHDDLTEFDEGDPSASAREEKRAEAMLHLEGLIREDYTANEVNELIEKVRNGLGHWLTFVTEPEVNSTNNRAERALREQVVIRKIFRSLRSAEGVRTQETITTMLATWRRRSLDPPKQLQSVLDGRDLKSP